MHHEHEPVDRDRADRREILDRIVIELGHCRRDRHRRRHGPEQRVAISRRPRNRVRGQRTIGADAIFHDEGLAEMFREALRDDARHHIRIAAGGIGDDDPHRPRRPRLRLSLCVRAERGACGEDHRGGKQLAQDHIEGSPVGRRRYRLFPITPAGDTVRQFRGYSKPSRCIAAETKERSKVERLVFWSWNGFR